MKTHLHSILQVPTTQLVNMSIDPKFVELTTDDLKLYVIKIKLQRSNILSKLIFASSVRYSDRAYYGNYI